jgi:hypothetical protein
MRMIDSKRGTLLYSKIMDSHPDTKRRKKSDKARRNFEKTGGLSQKHVRACEALQEKPKATAPSKGK